MKLGIDLDGVVYDYVNDLRSYLIKRQDIHPVGGDHNDPTTTWSFFKDNWGLTSDEFFKHCDDAANCGHLFYNGEAYPGALDALDRLKSQGHTIHIVTNRNFGHRSTHNTVDWLKKMHVAYDSLTISADKTIVDCDLFIEDYEVNFNDLWSDNKPCILFDRPWNRHVNAGEYRVTSWEEFETFVEGMANNWVS